MNILTDIMSLLRRKKYVDTVKPDDVLVLGIHEEPEILGVASPIPYKNVKLVKIKDLVINSQGCIHLNVPDPSAFAGIYKDTTTVDGQCYVNLRRLKSLSLNLTIVENGDFIDIDTTAEANEGGNVGGGAELYQMMVGEVLTFRTLTSSDGSLTIVQNLETVDIIITGGNCCSLEDTLVVGNTTGGRDIIMSATDSLFGDGASPNDARLNLQNGSVWLTCDGLNVGGWIDLNSSKGQMSYKGLAPTSVTAEAFVDSNAAALLLYIDSVPGSAYFAATPNITGLFRPILSDFSPYLTGVFLSTNNTITTASVITIDNSSAYINTGSESFPTLFISGTQRSVAVGGKGITVNADDTVFVNQISFQSIFNAFNTFIIPPTFASADHYATLQSATGTIAYLTDIPSGTGINNIYNVDGQLQANRIIDGNSRAYGPTFADLDQFQIRFTNVIYLECDALVIGGINSVTISTPNTIATLGKVGQVLTLNNTTGGCDWEDKYFAVDLDSTLPNVAVVTSGGNTTYTVTHNLDSLDVKPEIFKTSNGQTTYARIRRISVNEVTVRLKGTIANGDYRIII